MAAKKSPKEPELLDAEPVPSRGTSLETYQTAIGGGLQVFNKDEIDQQVATAKRYPRSLATFQRNLMSMATADHEIARSCIYALSRGGKPIEGPSARFAELVMSSYGNVRGGSRITWIDDKHIVAQGACHDLENNVSETFEVRRRITDKEGKRYSEDMIVVTGNAAGSIAFRNVVLKVVPSAYWKPVLAKVRQVIAGTAKDLKKRLGEVLKEIEEKHKVKPERVYAALGVKGPADIDIDKLVVLQGILTGIEEGDSSVEEAFGPKRKPVPEPTGEPPAGQGLVNASQEQKIREGLYKAIDEGGPSLAEFCKYFKIEATSQLPASKFADALAWIKSPGG